MGYAKRGQRLAGLLGVIVLAFATTQALGADLFFPERVVTGTAHGASRALMQVTTSLQVCEAIYQRVSGGGVSCCPQIFGIGACPSYYGCNVGYNSNGLYINVESAGGTIRLNPTGIILGSTTYPAGASTVLACSFDFPPKTLPTFPGLAIDTLKANTLRVTFAPTTLNPGNYYLQYGEAGHWCAGDNLYSITLNVTLVECPSPSATPSTTPTISLSPTRTPSESRTPSVTLTPSVSSTTNKSPSSTPSNSASGSVSASITPSESITPSITASTSMTGSISRTPSISQTALTSRPASVTPTRTASPSVSVTLSVTPVPSITPSQTRSRSPSPKPTNLVGLTCRGVPCLDDGNLCTAELCINERCTHQPISCEDGDQCTIDSCVPDGSCQHSEIPGCREKTDCSALFSCSECLAASGCSFVQCQKADSGLGNVTTVRLSNSTGLSALYTSVRLPVVEEVVDTWFRLSEISVFVLDTSDVAAIGRSSFISLCTEEGASSSIADRYSEVDYICSVDSCESFVDNQLQAQVASIATSVGVAGGGGVGCFLGSFVVAGLFFRRKKDKNLATEFKLESLSSNREFQDNLGFQDDQHHNPLFNASELS